jgi:hypothetical protein
VENPPKRTSEKTKALANFVRYGAAALRKTKHEVQGHTEVLFSHHQTTSDILRSYFCFLSVPRSIFQKESLQTKTQKRPVSGSREVCIAQNQLDHDRTQPPHLSSHSKVCQASPTSILQQSKPICSKNKNRETRRGVRRLVVRWP